MADQLVREIGRLRIGGYPFVVGIDRGAVTLGFPGTRIRLTTEAADGLAAHLITAIWQAGDQASAQDEDGSPGQRRPLPAVEPVSGGIQLAAGNPPSPAASPDFEALARDMLSRFTKTSDGHRARVGQVQIAKWTEQLGGGGDA